MADRGGRRAGESASQGTPEVVVPEFGDVLAWLASLANFTGVDLEHAAARYASGCPKCGAIPCVCEF